MKYETPAFTVERIDPPVYGDCDIRLKTPEHPVDGYVLNRGIAGRLQGSTMGIPAADILRAIDVLEAREAVKKVYPDASHWVWWTGEVSILETGPGPSGHGKTEDEAWLDAAAKLGETLLGYAEALKRERRPGCSTPVASVEFGPHSLEATIVLKNGWRFGVSGLWAAELKKRWKAEQLHAPGGPEEWMPEVEKPEARFDQTGREVVSAASYRALQQKLEEAEKEAKAFRELSESLNRKLAEANNDRDNLQYWKDSHLKVESWWTEVDTFVRKHPDAILGASVAHEAIRLIRERDDLKKQLEVCNRMHGRRIDELASTEAQLKKVRKYAGSFDIATDPEVETLGYEWQEYRSGTLQDGGDYYIQEFLRHYTEDHLILVRREQYHDSTGGGIRTVPVKRGELETFKP